VKVRTYTVTALLLMTVTASPAHAPASSRPRSTPPCSQTWRLVATPSPRGRVLYDIAALSRRDAWAVGSQARGKKPLIEHWDGRSWSVVRSTAGSGVLNAVAAVSPDDVWTVGDVHVAGVSRPLVEHWDGRRWSNFATPVADGILAGLLAFSPTSVWASDSAEGGSSKWDGAAWLPLGFDLGSVLTGTSDTDVWTAFGVIRADRSPEAFHWDGSSWEPFLLPAPSGGEDPSRFYAEPIAATAFSRGSAWIGGYVVGYPSFFASFIDHWDGSRWRIGYRNKAAFVNDIAAISQRDVWAVGALPAHGGASRTTATAFVVHWDGAHWRQVHAPAAGLYAAAATATDDVWAVGGMPTDAVRDYNVDDNPGRRAVIEHIGCFRRH
jgi:hypothetical protein